jgi:ATP-dependent exoDNAse (exonuclease V) alpha subunit
MLARARQDLHVQVAPVFGLAPTAKAARVLERDTGIVADTVAKLLHEWSRPDLEPESRYRLPATTTVVVDEAGMIATPDLRRLVKLAQHTGRGAT